jgi:TrkA domain protein
VVLCALQAEGCSRQLKGGEDLSISEQELPGIGRRYEIAVGRGRLLVLVIHHSGRRDLYVLAHGRDEPVCTVELSDDQARRVGFLLGGGYFKPAMVEEIADIIGDFVVDWVTLTEDAPAIGLSIQDLKIRRKTGMTVIAIIRGKKSINAPDPSEVLQAGDRIVVVGPRDRFAGFMTFVMG